MGNTQSKVYVQNEHKVFTENIVKLIEKEKPYITRSNPFKHREHRKEAKFAYKMKDDSRIEFEAENHWSILSKI